MSVRTQLLDAAAFAILLPGLIANNATAGFPLELDYPFRIYGINGGIEFDPEVNEPTSLQGWTLKTSDSDQSTQTASIEDPIVLNPSEHLLFDLSLARFAVGTFGFSSYGGLSDDVIGSFPPSVRDDAIYQLGGDVFNRQGLPGVPPIDLTPLFGNAYAVALFDDSDIMQFFVQLRVKDSPVTVQDESIAQAAIDAGLWSAVDDYLEYDLGAWWYERRTSAASGPEDYHFFSFPEPTTAGLLLICLSTIAAGRRR